MRARLAILAAAALAAATAAGQPAEQRRKPRFFERSSPITAVYPFAGRGVLLPDDSGTVSHVTWNGSALVDSAGNSWTQNGTVPQNVPSGLYPETFAGAERKGSGPYSDTNYYQLGAGSDVLDFTGDFTASFVMAPTTLAGCTGQLIFFSNGLVNADGWYVQHDATGLVALRQWTSGSGGTVQCNGGSSRMLVGGPSVVSVGRSGSTLYCKINDDTTGTAAAVAATPATTRAALLGRYTNTGFSCGALLYEATFSSRAWDEAAVTQKHRHTLSHLGSQLQAVSVVRATAITSAPQGGCFHTLPVAVAPVSKDGVEVYRQATNNILRDTQVCGGADWADVNTGGTTPCAGSGGADTTAGPDCAATVDGDTVEDDSATGAEGRTNAGGCGLVAGSYTLSCYLRSGTLTTATLRIAVTGGTGTNKVLVTGLDSTWQRKHLTVTAGVGTSTVAAQVYPGDYDTVANTGTIIVDHCDCIPLDQPHPHICTSGAATSANLTNVSVSAAGGVLSDEEGCAAVTITCPSTWKVDPNYNRILGLATGNTLLDMNPGGTPGTRFEMFDGLNNATQTTTQFAGRSARLRANWSKARGKMCVEEIGVTACAEATYDGTLFGGNYTVWPGTRNGANDPLDCALEQIVLGTRWGACE